MCHPSKGYTTIAFAKAYSEFHVILNISFHKSAILGDVVEIENMLPVY